MCTRCVLGLCLVCTWFALCVSLMCTWFVLGVYLVCIWCILGVYLVCTWCVLAGFGIGVYLACWHIGVYLAHCRRLQCRVLVHTRGVGGHPAGQRDRDVVSRGRLLPTRRARAPALPRRVVVQQSWPERRRPVQRLPRGLLLRRDRVESADGAVRPAILLQQ